MALDSTDSTQGQDDVTQMLQACLQSARVTETACRKIDKMDLFKEGIHVYGEVWAVLRNYVLEFKMLPSVGEMTTELRDRKQSGASPVDFQVAQATHLIKTLKAREELGEKWVYKQIDNMFSMDYKRKLVAIMQLPLAEQEQDQELADQLANAVLDLKASLSSFVRPVNPFRENFNDYLHQTPRTSCGVGILDDMSGGGPYEGEMLALIMAYKSGKTTLAIQLAEAMVTQNRYVSYMSFEQKVKGDITTRMAVRASDSVRDAWKPGNLEDVFAQNKAVMARFEANRDKWAKYLDIYEDFATPDFELTSVSDIFAPIYRKFEETGEKTSCVIIDWWGLMLNKLKSHYSRHNYMSDTVSRQMQQIWVGEIKAHTQKCVDLGMDTFTLVFHQLAGAETKKGPGRQARTSQAQGDSNFNNLFDYAAAGVSLGASKVNDFCCDAARGAEGGTFSYRLDGQSCKYVALDSEEILKVRGDNIHSSRGRRKTT